MGKTAVVIIHGVGEQQPMATVRGFVRFFAGSHFRSKVDRGANSFEQRRLSTYASNEHSLLKLAKVDRAQYPPDTVFYEYYWAFHYRDTEVGLVLRWVIGTIGRFVSTGEICRVRGRALLIVLAWMFILIAILGGVGWACYDLAANARLSIWSWASLIGSLLSASATWLVRPVFLGWVGDAARYFGSSPSNPVERQAIREQGIQLLRRLHEQRVRDQDPKKVTPHEYDRIVVVGHSLGSVIAYDILAHYWAQVCNDLEIDESNPQLTSAREFCGENVHGQGQAASPPQVLPKPPANLDPARQWHWHQREIAKSCQFDAWRVSDFVSLGSPLTYAPVLLGKGRPDMQQRFEQRELPKSPPQPDLVPDQHGNRSFVYHYAPTVGSAKLVPHSAAPFMLTRWTNLYLRSDPIGGPLAPVFGKGVLDCEISFGAKAPSDGAPCIPRGRRRCWQWLLDKLGGAHNEYWNLDRRDDRNPLVPQAAELLWPLLP